MINISEPTVATPPHTSPPQPRNTLSAIRREPAVPASACGRLALAAALLALSACGDGTTLPPVEPNQPPQPVGAIPLQQVAFGDSITVNVAGYFRDPDGDPLNFTATSADPGIVAAAVGGGGVTVRGVSRGTATVAVTATDPGGLSARQAFEARVPNRGPEAVGTIEDPRIEVGDSIAIGLAGYFADPEGDSLDFSATSTDNRVARAAVAGDTAWVVAVAKGTATVTVTARDPEGRTADQSFTVAVPNRRPLVTTSIPADSVLLGDTLELSLSAHFTDPDGDSLSFSAESSEPDVAMARVSGSTLVVVPAAPGRTSITVTASDPEGLSAAQAFDATSVRPNRAPVAEGMIPDTVIYVGMSDSLDVSPFFSDPDGDSLTYTATTSRSIRVTVAVSGSILRLRAVSLGNSAITVTARDPGGLPARQRFRAFVEPTPAPDLAVDTPAVNTDRVKVGGQFIFSALVRNLGNAEAQSPGTLSIHASFDPRISPADPVVATDSVIALGPGQASEVSVIVTGPSGVGILYYGACIDPPANETNVRNNCSQAVPVTFWQPNRAPQPRDSIPDRTVGPGDTIRIGLSRFFTDPDLDSLRFTAESSDPTIATASVSGSTLTVAGRAEGNAAIVVTAHDVTSRTPGSLSATQRFEVTVRILPRPDLVAEMPVDSFHIAPDESFIVNAIVRNRGSDQSSATTVRFLLSTDRTIDPDDRLIGTDAIDALPAATRITASTDLKSPSEEGTYYYGACVDPVAGESRTSNNCSSPVAVVVEEAKLPNRPPVASRSFSDISGAQPGERYRGSLTEVFSDPDGDPLTYTTSSSDATIADATVAGDTLFVHAVSPGSAKITVVARDPAGFSAATDFYITVVAPCTGFCIDLGFTSAVEERYRDHIGAGVGGWQAILAGTELSDITIPAGTVCRELTLTDTTVVDDHLFLVHVAEIDGPGGTLALAGTCFRRSGSPGLPIVSRAVFDAADIDDLAASGVLVDVAFHEMAHGLGFLSTYFDRAGFLAEGSDPHFTGSAARGAFNAAGGNAYAGAKVPLEGDLSHWRESVLGAEIMTPQIELQVAQPASAITLGAMADIGYAVDFVLANDYRLPGPGAPPAVREGPRRVFDLSGDVEHGPVAILGPDGRVVDLVIPRGYAPPARTHSVTIDLRSPGGLRASSSYVSWIREAPARRPS